MPRASPPSSRSARRSSRADDHDQPRPPRCPAGAGRGLRRGDVGDDCDLAAPRHARSSTSRPARRRSSMTVTDDMLNGHGTCPRRLHLHARRQRLRLRLQQLQPAHRRAPGVDHLPGARPARRPADRGRPRGLPRRARRHLRRARDERARRAGRGVPRPFPHRQGNPPAGVIRRRATTREEETMPTA